jgi:dTDP-4-dehydrorhamnose reductase
MIKILATGMSGLVGTRVNELLSDEFDIEDLSLATGVDITNYESLENRINNSNAKIIIHMAAKTDVDSCEDEKILNENSQCWQVNVVATENISYIANKRGMKVIYISTDFVFDGIKKFYNEEDKPNPVNWYGFTKFEGENKVKEHTEEYVILRISYPYRANFSLKRDFVRRLLEKMVKKEKIYGLTDHIITPTFIDDIAQAIKTIIQKKVKGIYHVVGSQSLSVYDCIGKIASVFGQKPIIIPVKREEYFKEKAFRPFNLTMKNDKITKLGCKMKTLDDGLFVIKTQRLSNI